MEHSSDPCINIVRFEVHYFCISFMNADASTVDKLQLKYIRIKCHRIPSSAFHHFHKLLAVEMDDTITEIGVNAFINCSSLKNVKMSSNITSIGDSTFSGCKSLPSIFIPPGCQDVDRWAFGRCESLKMINIPASVQLGNNVVCRCTKLLQHSPFDIEYDYDVIDDGNAWLSTRFDNLPLHTLCCSIILRTYKLHIYFQNHGHPEQVGL